MWNYIQWKTFLFVISHWYILPKKPDWVNQTSSLVYPTKVITYFEEKKKKSSFFPSCSLFQHLLKTWNISLKYKHKETFILLKRQGLTEMKNGLTVGGSATALLSNTHTHKHIKGHTHPHVYRHTFNREHRSSRWASSWLTVTHWWRENITRLLFSRFLIDIILTPT